MPWYRIGEPGKDAVAHMNFGRKASPAGCRAPKLEGDSDKFGEICARMSVALCDAPAGQDLAGKPLTCDMPICETHRTPGGRPNVDYCPRHRALAQPGLPL